MAAASKASCKSHFETGDIPTQAQFQELIDSYTDFSDVLLAIATAAQAGGTGVVIIESSTDATTQAIGAMGKRILTAETTASTASMFNLMTTDTTQTISGDKTFQGMVRISAGVTIKNTKSQNTLRLVNTDATAGNQFTPRIVFAREFESTDLAAGDNLGGLQFEAQSSAGASQNFTWGQLRVAIASASTSAGASYFEIWTRQAGDLEQVARFQRGVVVSGTSLTGGDLGRGTVNAERFYDDGRQIAPNMQAFAWGMITGTGTPAVTNGINLASIVDNGAGDYSVVFSTVASDANYGVQIFIGGSTASSPPTVPRFSYVHTATAGGCRFVTVQGAAGASAVDFERITLTFWDDNPSQGTRVP